uniref:ROTUNDIFOLIA like 8 n=1 Tax=Aegilops tauschii subsp. strangulata TaxID=200361 RepID=A0A452Z9F9_AEGTS
HVLPSPPAKFRLRSSSRPGALIGRKEAEIGWKGASMDKCGLPKKRSGKGAMATRKSGGGPSSFPRRCARLVREQRARFYIARRCVAMLACWRHYS